MLFVSFEFLLFFIAVFGLYWSIGSSSRRIQNIVLLVAGLIFYGRVDLGFLALLLLSASVNFTVGLLLSRAGQRAWRNTLFWAGVAINVGLLCYFKYFEFFANSFIDLLEHFGHAPDHFVLDIALPLGISFYTFQMLGYLIDVNNEEIEPSKEPLDFFCYVMFFPKLLAGPVERAQHFLPQIARARRFDTALAIDGTRQFLWGMFAKVVLAENCAEYVDAIFKGYSYQNGSTVVMGACLYLIQLYCDFAGYSNMAIGAGKMFGITMRPNFRYPLFAISVGDFWRRWHVSLTSWMMDYLFTPISFIFRGRGRFGTLVATTVTFMVVGLWHGANWTYVLFGAIQSALFVPLVFSGTVNASPRPMDSVLPGLKEGLRMAGMFLLMATCFMLLRAETVTQATTMWAAMCSSSLFGALGYLPWLLFMGILAFISWEWMMRGREHGLSLTGVPRIARFGLYYALLALIVLNMDVQNEFIYFQF